MPYSFSIGHIYHHRRAISYCQTGHSVARGPRVAHPCHGLL